MSRGKTFPCGHRGKGQFCHRCAALESERATQPTNGEAKDGAKPDEVKVEKAQWEATFEDDPIDLHHLPTKQLVLRAREILEAVGRGAPWHQFNGKRLQHDRNVVSVPLGRRYRILFRTDEGSPKPVKVLSHEAYNGTKPGRR
ncbi:MAG: hypothetical protein HC927_06870 [Deltaproteobacteria bacterium]|nr:hypothetical protein [Deltaproteobacteria bacterium]